MISTNSETIKPDTYVLVEGEIRDSSEIKFQVLDKGYVTAKEYKKLAKSLKKLDSFSANKQDLYHIRIVN